MLFVYILLFLTTFLGTCSAYCQLQNFGKKELIRRDGRVTADMLAEVIEENPNVQYMKVFGAEVKVLKKGLYSGLVHLESVALKSAQVTEIERGAFGNLPTLTHLTVTGNDLPTLRTGCFENLPVHAVYLSRNRISAIEDSAFAHLPNLTHVDLQENELRAWNSKGLENVPNIRTLILEDNKLQKLIGNPFANAKSLRSIDLSRNQLTQIGSVFLQLAHLKEVNLAINRLVELPEDLFVSQITLHDFAVVFNVKRKLNFLSLQYNNLTHLPDRLLEDLVYTAHFQIDLNPWNCHCYFKIVDWARRNKVALYDRYPKCANVAYPVCLVPLMDEKKCGKLSEIEVDHYASALKTVIGKNSTDCINGYHTVYYLNLFCEYDSHMEPCV